MRRSLILLPFLLFPLFSSSALASPGVIVTFHPGVSGSERAHARARAGVRVERSLGLKRVQLLRPQPGLSPAQALQRLRRAREVESADLNQLRRIADLQSDEPLGDKLYALGQPSDADLDAAEAWTANQGEGATVAVIDLGVDHTHPDLAAQMWRNPGEIGGNQVDDDGNGRVDDLHGWNFADNTAASGPTPTQEGPARHGTHVAGIIAAASNRLGVLGIAPRAKIMSLNVGARGAENESSLGITDGAIIEAVAYAAGEGAQVVNLSLGSNFETRAFDAPFRAVQDQVAILAAAGNEAANLERTPSFPCMARAENVFCVGASGVEDEPAAYTNFGRRNVDIFAPGSNILSTVPGGRYMSMSGTSMATPYAAGVTALLSSAFPALTPAQRLQRLELADHPRALAGLSRTGGRVNAALALGVSAPPLFQAEVSPAQPSAGSAISLRPLNPPPGAVSLRYTLTAELPSGDKRSALEAGLEPTPHALSEDESCLDSYRVQIRVSARMEDGSGVSGSLTSLSVACPPQSGSTVGTLRLRGRGMLGSARADQLLGDELGDAIMGLGSQDYLQGGGASDLLAGGSGNDRVRAESGHDLLGGEAGNDQLFGGRGDDRATGGSGRDQLWGESGDDGLYGGEGSDRMQGGTGNDLLAGENGNERARGDQGNDQLYGNAGVDALLGGAGNDLLSGGPGDDSPCYTPGGARRPIGSPGCQHLPARIIQNTSPDSASLAAVLSLRGEAGDDLLLGGAGNDALGGDAGADRLYGDTGNDLLQGGSGNDLLQGGAGEDILIGDSGDDLIWLGEEDELVSAGPGNDQVYAHQGAADHAQLDCGEGNDTLIVDSLDSGLRARRCEQIQLSETAQSEPASPSDRQPALLRSIVTELELTRQLKKSRDETYRIRAQR